MKHSIRQTIAGLVLALIAAAIVAGGVSAAPTPDWFERAAARHVASGVAADAHDRSTTSSATVTPDWFERAAARGGATRVLDVHQRMVGALGAARVVQPTPAPDGGFAWGDAALGAVAAFALALAAGAAVLSLRHHKRVALP